jgi:DNA repair protein RecN (Recombination protein N)
MLKKLSIQNYALIEELEIPFTDGMTIITGETGAGKSILLGALALLIGSRADSGSLYKKNKKCIIEGEFSLTEYKLDDFFTVNDIDYENITTIRREISPEGKSRAFINDTPVNLALLKDLGSRLIEIHSQHETLTLNDSGFQMMVLDSFAKIQKKVSAFSALLTEYNRITENINILRERELQSKKDFDYYNFLYTELSESKLSAGEQELLETELSLLNNSEEIKTTLVSVQSALSGDENDILTVISTVALSIQQLTKLFPKAEELADRLKSVRIEVKDIAAEIESLEREVVPDPARAEVINERLDIIYKLQHKHRVKTIDELLEIMTDLDAKLTGISFLHEEIEKLEKVIENCREELVIKGKEIHDLRSKVIPQIEKNIGSLLLELGMKNAGIKIELLQLTPGQFRSNGTNAVKFLFSANKGVEFRELGKVASGGELSRLMLSIKSLIAKLTGLPTIIFDEIDTGISGEIAHKVGNIVKEMSVERQVIVITHLPQMAVKGNEHLYVYKELIADATVTSIRKLSSGERVEEIAKMLSGNKPTSAALANARELLGV